MITVAALSFGLIPSLIGSHTALIFRKITWFFMRLQKLMKFYLSGLHKCFINRPVPLYRAKKSPYTPLLHNAS
jgi:hypothetical protein